jgi:hypothetical protein
MPVAQTGEGDLFVPTWTLTVFDHRGRTVSRLETASGLVLVPGRDRLDVHLAPFGQSRLARVREGSLSIGDLHIEAVRGIHDALVFAAWSTKDEASIAGASWPTMRARRDVLAHLASLLCSSRVSPVSPGCEQLVATASRLHRLASR